MCSWNRFSSTDKRDSIQPDLSLYVHECVELQLSLLPEMLESQSERSSVGDDLDGNENQFLLKLQKGISKKYTLCIQVKLMLINIIVNLDDQSFLCT